ncbi:MAG: nucleotide sugar dehydrogenase [Acidobacteria bacterium]|nr:nucleotide sugar dehydrogenase [Acidobacteriota bacterium]
MSLERTRFERDVCIIGGGGHVGLPLALTFADSGLRTVVYDINAKVVESIRSGQMPFREEGADEVLGRVLASGTLEVESSPSLLSTCEFVVLIVGTPVDEHLNPNFTAMQKALEQCLATLRDGQTLILRSTVFPGISGFTRRWLSDRGLDVRVAFCPERVAQGQSIREFRTLPQIISAFDRETLAKVRALFARFTADFVELEPMEAELAKLMTNAWRYVQFATVNQFYMIAKQQGLDFDRILHACRHNYPRMAGMPGPGFAAGPCLMKDTMQLAAFSGNQFVLGHAAMLVNEGLPAFMIEMAEREGPLTELTAGILGMSFKSESDDPRDSLSYKLRKVLKLKAREVLCSDPYISDPSFVGRDELLAKADVIFVGTPHPEYRGLALPAGRRAYDVWSILSKETR